MFKVKELSVYKGYIWQKTGTVYQHTYNEGMVVVASCYEGASSNKLKDLKTFQGHFKSVICVALKPPENDINISCISLTEEN